MVKLNQFISLSCSSVSLIFRSAGMLMYQLLGKKLPLWNGEVPFTANLDDIFFDTLLREIDFDWIEDCASPGAADLCSQLLTRDPKKRLTAAQAAEHPWLVEED